MLRKEASGHLGLWADCLPSSSFRMQDPGCRIQAAGSIPDPLGCDILGCGGKDPGAEVSSSPALLLSCWVLSSITL